MNLKCHFSALEPTLLSIENKLIIFDLTIFNCGISIISFLINLKTSPFLSQKPIFLLVFIRFHPIQFSRKPLYMRELDNIYLLTFNNKQTKQRERNEQFTKTCHGPIWNFCITGHCREDQELGHWQEKRRERRREETRWTVRCVAVKKKSKTSDAIDGIVIVCETIATLLKNSKKLVKILEKLRGPPK